MIGNALFIIWRESVEALLVIGILYTWIKYQPQFKVGIRYLWIGIAGGIGTALLLAAAMLFIQNQLTDAALDYFQISMVFIAGILITQMVFWMRKHGKTLKNELEHNLQKTVNNANWWGMAMVVALAVGREGAETVIFLYGLGLEKSGTQFISFLAIAIAGFCLAGFTFWLLIKSGRYLSWRLFFRLSETILLLLAAAMLINGTEKLIGLGVLPSLIDPVWDLSFLINENSRIGGLLAGLIGYRAQPNLTLIIIYLTYWIAVFFILRASRPHQPTRSPS